MKNEHAERLREAAKCHELIPAHPVVSLTQEQAWAAADEIERLASKLDEYEHREKLHMDRCRHDMERIVRLEQQNEALASRLGALQKAIEADLSDAKAVCGGDGEGCETYRGYYDSAERRHRKCGQCPMDAIFHARRALASLDVAVLKGDRFTGTDCDFYEPGNGDACMNCGTTHESPAVETQGKLCTCPHEGICEYGPQDPRCGRNDRWFEAETPVHPRDAEQ